MDAHGDFDHQAISEEFWEELLHDEMAITSSYNYLNNWIDLETIYDNCASFCGDIGSEFLVGMCDYVKEPKNEHIDQGKMLEMEKEGDMDLSLEKISNFFHLAIRNAAKELKVGETTLKNKCRELGLERWPNRKLKSLQTLMNNIQKEGEQGSMNEVQDTVNMVKEKIELIKQFPNTPLGEDIKKIRQFCFKNNNKKKKWMKVW